MKPCSHPSAQINQGILTTKKVLFIIEALHSNMKRNVKIFDCPVIIVNLSLSGTKQY